MTTRRYRYEVTADMAVGQAIDILDTYCSDWDPIYQDGKETTAHKLIFPKLYRDHSDAPASKIIIEYHNSKHRRVTGTLMEMVFDRMGLKVRTWIVPGKPKKRTRKRK